MIEVIIPETIYGARCLSTKCRSRGVLEFDTSEQRSEWVEDHAETNHPIAIQNKENLITIAIDDFKVTPVKHPRI